MKAAHEGAPVAALPGGIWQSGPPNPFAPLLAPFAGGGGGQPQPPALDTAIRRPRRARAGSGGTAARADAYSIAGRPSQRRSVRFRRSHPARGRSRQRAGPEDQCLFEQDFRDTLGESAGFPAQRTVVRCYLSARTGGFPSLAPGVSESCVRAGSTEFVRGSSPERMTEEDRWQVRSQAPRFVMWPANGGGGGRSQ